MEYRKEQVDRFISETTQINNLTGPIPDSNGELSYGDEYISQVLDDLHGGDIELYEARRLIHTYLVNQIENQKGDIYLTMLTEFIDKMQWVKDLEIEVFGKPTFTEPLIKDVMTKAYENSQLMPVPNVHQELLNDINRFNEASITSGVEYRFPERNLELKEVSRKTDEYFYSYFFDSEVGDLIESLPHLMDSNFESYHLGMLQRLFRNTDNEEYNFIPIWLKESNVDKPYKDLISILYNLNIGELEIKLTKKLTLKERKEIFSSLKHSALVDPLELNNCKEIVEFILIKVLCSFPLNIKEVEVLKDFLDTNKLNEFKEGVLEYFTSVYESKRFGYTAKILRELLTNS